jgi:Fur family ferric uptake transcriptional regulator
VTTTTQEPAARLRAAGLRVTRPRLTVLEVCAEHPHAPADLVVREVRERLGSISVQGAYDVLAALTVAGLLRRVEPAGSPARYEVRVADNHHHVVCRSCGAMADVDCAIGAAPCLDPVSAVGFAIDEAEVTWWGLCADCQRDGVHRPQPGQNT